MIIVESRERIDPEFSIVGHTSDSHPLLWDKPEIKSHLVTSEKVVNEREILDDQRSLERKRKLPFARREAFRHSHLGKALNKLGVI